jgi:uncharacterized membrane protein YfcA
MSIALVVVASILAATLGGVLGFGTSSLLLPILSLMIGTELAVPALGIGMTCAGLSRAAFAWKELDWPVILRYSAVSIPASLLGAALFLQTDLRAINLILAVVVLLIVPARRYLEHRRINMQLHWFPALGGAVGLITGLGGAVGPTVIPFLLSYGLIGAACVGTDGMNSAIAHLVRTIVYASGGALPAKAISIGSGLGIAMIAGSYAGHRLLKVMNAKSYTLVIEASLIVMGAIMLWRSLAAPP